MQGFSFNSNRITPSLHKWALETNYNLFLDRDMFTHLTMTCALFGTTGQDRKSCGPSKASWVPRRDRQALSCCQTWLTHNTNRSMTPSGDQSPVPIWGKEAGQQNWICSALMIKHHVAKVKYQKDIWEGISQTGFPVNSSMFLITSPCATLNDPFPNIWACLGLQVEKKPTTQFWLWLKQNRSGHPPKWCSLSGSCS